MGFEAKIQQKINAYRQTHPKVKMSDEQIVSILVKNGEIVLSEDQKRSLFANNSKQNNNTGLKLEKTAKKPNPEKTIYLQSGRKVVYSRLSNGKTVMKYFGADGTRINPDYFKKVEGQISISADGNSYTVTKNGKKQTLKAKNPTQGAIDQNIAKLNNQEKALNKAKKEQGWIGKGWDWFKNKTGIGDGSDKAQKQIDAERKLLKQVKTGKISKKDFKETTGLDYTKENLAKFQKGELSQAETKINGYKEGQDMATDMVGDIVSGVAAFTIYTAAIAATPLTGGTSLALGFGLATASGAAIKVGVKALDTVGTDKKYTWNDCKHDAATGAFSGGLSVFTAGLGGAAGKATAQALGIQAIKSTTGKVMGKEATKGILKSALVNPAGYEYVGGTTLKRGLATAAEMATDGAWSGAIDSAFRTALDGGSLEDVTDSAVKGYIGGTILSPIIGGGMKAAGKHLSGNNLQRVMKDFPEEVETLSKMTMNGEPRFNGDDIAGLAWKMRHFPNEVKALSNIQLDGKPRFNSNEIFRLTEKYKDNSELIDKLATLKINDKPRFDCNSIDSLLYSYDKTTDEKYLNQLLNLEIDGKLRFSGDDIASLFRKQTLSPENRDINRIIELAKYKLDGKFRFNGEDICFIANSANKNEIDEVIGITINGKPRFSKGIEISNIAYGLKKNPKEMKELLEISVEGKPRFSTEDSYYLAKCAEFKSKMPELADIFLNAKFDGKYRFNEPKQLYNILDIAKRYPETAVEALKLTHNGKEIDGAYMSEIIKANSEYPEELKSVLAMQRFDESFFPNVIRIAAFKKYAPELFEKSLNEKINNKYRFSDNDLVTISFVSTTYSDAVKKMIDRKVNGKAIFNAENIRDFVEIYNNPSTANLFDKLISIKKTNSKKLFDINYWEDTVKLKRGLNYNAKEIQDLLNNEKFPTNLIKDAIKNEKILNYAKWINRSVESMNKGEKRAFMNDMLAFKHCDYMSKDLAKYFPAVPKTESEYMATMKRISQSLNISLEKLPTETCAKFNSSLKGFENTIEKIDLSKLENVSLSMQHTTFIQRIERVLNRLSKEEQAKVKDFYGFDIRDGKLSGYPENLGRDLNSSEFSNKSALKEIASIIEEYKNNNFIIVKDNPELNKVLKDISKLMPEIFNQVDSSKTFVNMLKTAQSITKNSKFAKLSDSDKKVLTFATLLHNTDKNFGDTTDSAFDAFFIAQKFGFSDNEAKKVYSIVQSSNLIEKFMATSKDKIVKEFRGVELSTTERKNVFERLAFDLKDGNNFELAQMLYSAKDKDGLTRYLDKMLDTKIKEIKSADFILPQTPAENYMQRAVLKQISKTDEQTKVTRNYNVKIVNSSDLDDLYAFIHTPECGFASISVSRNTKFANFEAFSNISDDKIICTSYVSKDKICGAAKHGFIFDVPNDKQFVGMGHDIFSLCKNTNDMLTEYYDKNSMVMANKGRGIKYKHRTMISDNLKQILNISNEEYAKRLDNIKAKLGNKPMTLENLSEIDLDFANAYKEFLSRDNTGDKRISDALLRSDKWNEVLVSNPKISAIFTRDLDNIPEEYLKKAQEEGLPIIVLPAKK